MNETQQPKPTTLQIKPNLESIGECFRQSGPSGRRAALVALVARKKFCHNLAGYTSEVRAWAERRFALNSSNFYDTSGLQLWSGASVGMKKERATTRAKTLATRV